MNRAVTVFYLRNIADAFNSGLIFTSLYAYYVRATVLSMNSQVNALGQLGGGLAIGALGIAMACAPR